MTPELVLVIAAITYGTRALALAILPPMPPRLARVLERMPAPLFAGLAAQALVGPGGDVAAAEVLAAGKNLVVVGRAGVGVDNIDVDAATARGIVVVNAPAAITIATAEHTLGLMFSLARHVPLADRLMKDGQWKRSQLVGTELTGKTLGLVGLGRVGWTDDGGTVYVHLFPAPGWEVVRPGDAFVLASADYAALRTCAGIRALLEEARLYAEDELEKVLRWLQGR